MRPLRRRSPQEEFACTIIIDCSRLCHPPSWREIKNLLYRMVGPCYIGELEGGNFRAVVGTPEIREGFLTTLAETGPNRYEIGIYRERLQICQILVLRCPGQEQGREQNAEHGRSYIESQSEQQEPPEQDPVAATEGTGHPQAGAPSAAEDSLIQAVKQMSEQMGHLSETSRSQGEMIKLLFQEREKARDAEQAMLEENA